MADVFIVLAIALGVIVVIEMIVFPIIEAQANCSGGSTPFKASQGRCFHKNGEDDDVSNTT
jgi:hypothetical protein